MARTANLTDFVIGSETSDEAPVSGFKRFMNRLIWAREGAALVAIKRDTGFLINDDDYRELVSAHRSRKPL